jgi:hypothetical protein
MRNHVNHILKNSVNRKASFANNAETQLIIGIQESGNGNVKNVRFEPA